MDSLSPTAGSVNWSIGFNLYAERQPIEACANNAQRRGWKDAQAGERAANIVASVFAAGGSPERADRVLANGW